MKNKKLIQMMIDVEKNLDLLGGNEPCDSVGIAWFDGVCLISGGNFLWLSQEVVSVTANKMNEIK